MKIHPANLASAVKNGIISPEQAKKLWHHFESKSSEQPQFRGLPILYYFGGLLVFSSMFWFLTSAWQNGVAIMIISGLFALMYVMVGRQLWSQPNLKIPGGLLITAAVGLTPVFIYGFQHATGLWPKTTAGNYQDYHIWIKGRWFFMEIGTIIASLIALRFFRFTFITFPLALSLWYLSMDLTPLLFGKHHFTFDERNLVSCIFGLMVLIGSYFIDKKYKDADFAFWTYLYGMLAFWVGLSLIASNSELNKLIYCLLNVGLIGLSIYLRRKVFIVFGTLGIFGYLTHLAWEVFKDSYIFPIILALLGLFIVFFGVTYQQNQPKFELLIARWLPNFLIRWRPEERD